MSIFRERAILYIPLLSVSSLPRPLHLGDRFQIRIPSDPGCLDAYTKVVWAQPAEEGLDAAGEEDYGIKGKPVFSFASADGAMGSYRLYVARGP